MENPEYFRFSNTPSETPKPWFRRKEVMRRLAFFTGSAVLLLFAIILTVNLVQSRRIIAESERAATDAEIAARQEDCAREDEQCKTSAQTQVARDAGMATACEGLAQDAQENCVTLIAQEKKDSSICTLLSGDARVVCSDSVFLSRVADGEGMELCDEVADETKKNSCKALVTATARASGNCGEYGVSEDVCNAQQVIFALLAAGNEKGCAEFPEEERVQCSELFSSTDADGDGLTAHEEVGFGTSDSNADTDGDGYSDSTEIKAGYNPLN